jgi:hypothetical protein
MPFRSETQCFQTLDGQECAECILARAHVAKHFPSHFESKSGATVVSLVEDAFEFRGRVPIKSA